MTTSIATTREQSARLQQCGVDPKTADMCWYKAKAANKAGYTWMLCSENYLKRRNSDEFIPAWSLSALLALLPKEICINGYAYRISIYFENPDEPVIGNQWCLYYKPKKKYNGKSRIADVSMYAPDLIECAVLMIGWLAVNNYKLNKL